MKAASGKNLLGTEVRGKTLGIAGFGRINQEVGARRAFRRHVVTHDPFISIRSGGAISTSALVWSTSYCASADYIFAPSAGHEDTRHLFDDSRREVQTRSTPHQHGSRRLVDEAALGHRD
jgi:phosphoglycerate dehydrogenase-like enzyme